MIKLDYRVGAFLWLCDKYLSQKKYAIIIREIAPSTYYRLAPKYFLDC